jgi:hypothetical protein
VVPTKLWQLFFASPQTSLLAAGGLCEEPRLKNVVLICGNLKYERFKWIGLPGFFTALKKAAGQ